MSSEKQWTAAEMGRKGGKKSRRILTSEQAKMMVEAREEKKHKIAVINQI